MGWYAVEVLCFECGQLHRAASHLQIAGCPTGSGLVTERHGDRPLPPALAELLRNALWCSEAGQYVLIGDPARVFVTPREQW